MANSKRRFVNQMPQSQRLKKAFLVILKAVKECNPGTFNELFDIAYPQLREIYEASGEEMMRLRTYEQLQNLVSRGNVRKDGKAYWITESGEKVIEEAETEEGDEQQQS